MIEHTVEANGVPLFVKTAGDPDGYPLILLHGWPESSRCWDEVAPLLSDRYRLIIPDQRGFGRSGMPADLDGYRMNELLGDIVGLLRWAGVERASLVGHDFGAAVTWQASAWLADHLDCAVTIAAPWPEVMRDVAAGNWRQLAHSYYAWLMQTDEGLALLTQDGGRLIADWAFSGFLPPETIDAYLAEWNNDPNRFAAMANWYRAHFSPDLFNPEVELRLRPPQIPVRYIHGEKDFAFAPGMETGSAAHVQAEADEFIIEGASHWMPHTHPEKIADLVVEWVERHR